MEHGNDRPVRNQGGDACKTSPASALPAITVGATKINDEVADYSNRGCCVDIFAPGTSIKSTYLSSTIKVLSGTSMAQEKTLSPYQPHLDAKVESVDVRS